MQREVYPGEFYRHFKNKLYQVIAVATHSETGESMVVYQALYGEFKVYVQPYEMFVGEADHEKYPVAVQKYCFEKVTLNNESTQDRETAFDKAFQECDAEGSPNPELLHFLDTEDYGQRVACLRRLAKTASQSDLDSIYMALDIKPQKGSLDAQIRGIEQYLSLRDHFDGRRLR